MKQRELTQFKMMIETKTRLPPKGKRVFYWTMWFVLKIDYSLSENTISSAIFSGDTWVPVTR